MSKSLEFLKYLLSHSEEYDKLSKFSGCNSSQFAEPFFISKYGNRNVGYSNDVDLIRYVQEYLYSFLRALSEEPVTLEEIRKVFTKEFFDDLGTVALQGVVGGYPALYLYTPDGAFTLHHEKESVVKLPFGGMYNNAVREKIIGTYYGKENDFAVTCGPVSELVYWDEIKELDETTFKGFLKDRLEYVGENLSFETLDSDSTLLMQALGGIEQYQTTGKQLIMRNETHYIQFTILIKDRG